ncbi:hypothetical protein JTB14_021292 [Gonioctena quinquepunctata]|nr:hypothetical protein JTB14_021292 [Gonioctena quinquepunctata]
MPRGCIWYRGAPSDARRTQRPAGELSLSGVRAHCPAGPFVSTLLVGTNMNEPKQNKANQTNYEQTENPSKKKPALAHTPPNGEGKKEEGRNPAEIQTTKRKSSLGSHEDLHTTPLRSGEAMPKVDADETLDNIYDLKPDAVLDEELTQFLRCQKSGKRERVPITRISFGSTSMRPNLEKRGSSRARPRNDEGQRAKAGTLSLSNCKQI